MARGYKQADPRHTKGYIVWLHPKTNDVLTRYGYKLKLQLFPFEKHHKTIARYLAICPSHGRGCVYLARLKYLTFVGPIPDGYTIDHIDGNTLNNDIRNLRAVPKSINYRDGGFLRKLRNNGINVALFPGIILDGYERMAQFKATHSKHRYDRLTKPELLQIFVGPAFVVHDPGASSRRNGRSGLRLEGSSDDGFYEPNKYYDPFCEKA